MSLTELLYWCERQNSAVRKLQPLQAWMLLLDAGLWSGFQRQKELSESFEKTVVTVRDFFDLTVRY